MIAEEALRPQIQSWGELAHLRQTEGCYDEAEGLYRRALEAAEMVLRPGDLDLAALLNGLGVLHKYQGRYDEAEAVYGRALAIAEAALEPGHPDLATLYHNLGGLEHARGRAADGEPWARLSVEVRQTALGPEGLFRGDHRQVPLAADQGLVVVDLAAELQADQGLVVVQAAADDEHAGVSLLFGPRLPGLRKKRPAGAIPLRAAP